MTLNRGRWVRTLRVDADERVEPVCATSFLDAARNQIGHDALYWAIRLGYDIAIEALKNFPEFGDGPAQVDTLRLGTESGAVIAMLGIDAGDLDTPEITVDAIRAIQEWVHRGITL